MPPKKNAKPQSKPAPAKPKQKTQVAPQRKGKQQPRRSAPGGGGKVLPWFTIARGFIDQNTPTGVIQRVLLHPASMPDSPYWSALLHHTHRREHWWEFRTMVTTASFTGCRLATVAVTDPITTMRDPTVDQVYELCANKRGSMSTTTRTSQHTTKFSITSATRILSNAEGDGTDQLGFTSATVFVYLCDPLVGLGTGYQLQFTILARVSLTPLNSMPGFGITPIAPPPTDAIIITLPDVGAEVPRWSHIGSTELAGGMYWDAQNTDKQHWSAQMQLNTVYHSEVQTNAQWANNRSAGNLAPKYFVRFNSASRYIIVGFVDLGQARTFCTHPSKVSAGAACCVTYNEPAGGHFFRVMWALDSQTTLTMVKTDERHYARWLSESGYGKPGAELGYTPGGMDPLHDPWHPAWDDQPYPGWDQVDPYHPPQAMWRPGPEVFEEEDDEEEWEPPRQLTQHLPSLWNSNQQRWNPIWEPYTPQAHPQHPSPRPYPVQEHQLVAPVPRHPWHHLIPASPPPSSLSCPQLGQAIQASHQGFTPFLRGLEQLRLTSPRLSQPVRNSRLHATQSLQNLSQAQHPPSTELQEVRCIGSSTGQERTSGSTPPETQPLPGLW